MIYFEATKNTYMTELVLNDLQMDLIMSITLKNIWNSLLDRHENEEVMGGSR